jgi:opacity protein-like surface antigen
MDSERLVLVLLNLVIAYACIGVTEAAEYEQPDFKLGGFGALGISHSTQHLGDYVIDSTVPKGAGISNNWATGNDSRLGIQLSANVSPTVSAVLQVISEYQADSNYHPGVEWANVKYAFAPNVYIRAGRIALPTFLHSDNRKVSYSYPWVHPPVDLYRQLAITSSDGVDGMYRFTLGNAENSIKAIYGNNETERKTSTSTSKNMWGLFDTFEYGPTTLRVGFQIRESSSLNHLTGITGTWTKNSDLSLGASYDPGNWFILSEWIQRKSTTKIDAMYISSGYRINNFTPYLTYSQNSMASFLPGFLQPTASAIQSAKRTESTVSLGLRWNFMRNFNFKLQYDQVRLGENSNGYLTNVPQGVILYGSTFHVTSALIDFVF